MACGYTPVTYKHCIILSYNVNQHYDTEGLNSRVGQEEKKREFSADNKTENPIKKAPDLEAKILEEIGVKNGVVLAPQIHVNFFKNNGMKISPMLAAFNTPHCECPN